MKLLSECPACGGNMVIRSMQCPNCNLELRNDFELSRFDQLNEQQLAFLLSFLRNRGNLSLLQDEMHVSYPSAKKQLSELLEALELEPQKQQMKEKREFDMRNWIIDPNSTKASDIIKAKLRESGGQAMIPLYDGELRSISTEENGECFRCPIINRAYSFRIFDVIVERLINSSDYSISKGSARKKLGEPGCDDNTAAGIVLKFMGKKPGESDTDPIYLLAAILDWAGIAHNERGYIELTAEYRARL